MDKNTFIEKIKASSVSEERKQKIIALLETNEFNFETKQLVKDILQEDIDADAVEMTPEDLAEAKTAEQQLVNDLAEVEKDLNEDMTFVQSEMNDLDGMVSDMDKTTDQAQIEAITADIKSS